MASTDQGFGAWLRAVNPMAKSQTEADAVRAARLGTVALVLMAIETLISAAMVWAARETMQAAMLQKLATQPTPAGADPGKVQQMGESMASIMPTVTVVVLVVFAVVWAILALVQWKKPNPIIPAIMLALTLLGLVTTVKSLAGPHTGAEAAMYSAGRTAYSLIASLVNLVLLAAAFMGALRLGRFRRETYV